MMWRRRESNTGPAMSQSPRSRAAGVNHAVSLRGTPAPARTARQPSAAPVRFAAAVSMSG